MIKKIPIPVLNSKKVKGRYNQQIIFMNKQKCPGIGAFLFYLKTFYL
jgi:hypothetical protein